jgi:hypothetical protein
VSTTRPTSTNVTNPLRQQPVKVVWTTLTNRNKKDHTENDDDVSMSAMTTTTTMTSTSTSSSRIPKSVRLPWQRQMTPTEDGYLMQHLLKHESFRRIIAVRKPNAVVVPGTVTTTTVDDEKVNTDTISSLDPIHSPPIPAPQLGSFDLSGTIADSLEGYVVAPLFQLRGMDIFLSEDLPEMESSTHPYLLEHGLRSVPTFIVNVLTQWGNIFIYFEMPNWVHGFDMMVHESDADDVKALKVCITAISYY